MVDTDEVLRRLLIAPKINRSLLATVPTEQGVYVLWLEGQPPACLKVGIAGPRNGKGLRARIGNHFGSNPASSVLARHLAADSRSRWAHDRNFSNRTERQRFLSAACCFQAIAVATDDRENSNHSKRS